MDSLTTFAKSNWVVDFSQRKALILDSYSVD